MIYEYREVIGYAAGILTTIAFFPQIYQIYITKSAKDVSMPMFAALFIGCLLWTFYGFLLGSESVVVINIMSSFLSAVVIILKHRFSKPHRK